MKLSDSQKNCRVLKIGLVPWSFLLLMAVTVPYFRSKGFSMAQIFSAQAVFSITLSVFDLPSGYFSDKVSRKATLLIAGAMKGMGGVLIIFANTFPLLVACYFLLGLGNSFYSGTDLAIIHDAHPDDRLVVREMASFSSISAISSTIAIVLGGYIAGESMKWAVVLNGLVACLPFFIYLFLVPTGSQVQADSVHSLQKALKTIKVDFLNARRFLFAGSAYSVFIFFLVVLLKVPLVIALFTYQKAFMDLGISVRNIGLIIATASLLSGLCAKKIPRLTELIDKQWLIFICVAMVALSYALIGAKVAVLTVIAFFIIDLANVLVAVFLLKEFNRAFDSTLRSTLNSFLSVASRIAVAVVAPVWGLAISKFGVDLSCQAMGVVFAFVLIFLIIKRSKWKPVGL